MNDKNKQQPRPVIYIYPANSLCLGDNVLMSVVWRGLQREYGHADVQLIPFGENIINYVKRYPPNKLFLRSDATCITENDIEKLMHITDTCLFDLPRLAHRYWLQNIFPSCQDAIAICRIGSNEIKNDEFRMDFKLQPRNYVILHLRNIPIRPEKNVSALMAISLVQLLIAIGQRIVIVGKDQKYNEQFEKYFIRSTIDYRNKLSLESIAHLLEYCRCFIGRDSGIAHLASCFDIPIVSWGYENEFWMPKVRKPNQCIFLKGDANWILIESAIMKMIRQYGNR